MISPITVTSKEWTFC